MAVRPWPWPRPAADCPTPTSSLRPRAPAASCSPASAVEPTLRARKGRPLFFIDIAVPRDVDPAVHELEGCYVYDIDDLEAVVSDSTPGRAGEVSRAEAIVAAEARAVRRLARGAGGCARHRVASRSRPRRSACRSSSAPAGAWGG